MTTPAGPGGGGPDPDLSAVTGERRRLVNLACRMAGSLTEAEDAGRAQPRNRRPAAVSDLDPDQAVPCPDHD